MHSNQGKGILRPTTVLRHACIKYRAAATIAWNSQFPQWLAYEAARSLSWPFIQWQYISRSNPSRTRNGYMKSRGRCLPSIDVHPPIKRLHRDLLFSSLSPTQKSLHPNFGLTESPFLVLRAERTNYTRCESPSPLRALPGIRTLIPAFFYKDICMGMHSENPERTQEPCHVLLAWSDQSKCLPW
jgi:hypothetical protein